MKEKNDKKIIKRVFKQLDDTLTEQDYDHSLNDIHIIYGGRFYGDSKFAWDEIDRRYLEDKLHFKREKKFENIFLKCMKNYKIKEATLTKISMHKERLVTRCDYQDGFQ